VLYCFTVCPGPEQPAGGPTTPAPGSAIWFKEATRPGGAAAAAAAPAGSSDDTEAELDTVSKNGPDLSKVLPSVEQSVSGEHGFAVEYLPKGSGPTVAWPYSVDYYGADNNSFTYGFLLTDTLADWQLMAAQLAGSSWSEAEAQRKCRRQACRKPLGSGESGWKTVLAAASNAGMNEQQTPFLEYCCCVCAP
jgi:hypothetical protein